MEQELIKHSLKIKKEWNNKDSSFLKKLKEISFEILIIVFAVTLSIWLHNWSEYNHGQKEARIFLINLKQDLQADIDNYQNDKTGMSEAFKTYNFIIHLTQKQVDSLDAARASINFPIHSATIKENDGNYESFKASGKLSLIENEQLKQIILKYYQNTIPNIKDADNFYNQTLFKSFDQLGRLDKINNQDFLNPKLQTVIFYSVGLGNNSIRLYDELGIKQAKEIVNKIEREIK